MTGDRSDSITIAVASKRSTTRKETYGYCQESCKETRCQKARRKEIGGGEETRREESGGEESASEKGCAEKSCEEARYKAQTERRIHEGNDAVVDTGLCRRQLAATAHRSHQENLGLHQEE